MYTIGALVTQTRAQLQDKSKRYWTDQELVDYANDGRGLLYEAQPRLYEKTADVTLAEGVEQALPDGSKLLFAPLYNVSHPHRRNITTVDAQLLGRARPRWRTQAATGEIVHVLYDTTRPRAFEVYPPAAPDTVIRMSYAAPPARFVLDDLTDDQKTLDEEGELAAALIDYCLHRAFGKQADTSPDAGQMSGDYLRLFMTKIGAEDAAKATSSTNAKTKGVRRAE